MKIKLMIAGAALLLASLIGSPRVVYAQNGCGIRPIKPIVPIGCKDLVLQCQCDVHGQNCRYVWLCAK